MIGANDLGGTASLAPMRLGKPAAPAVIAETTADCRRSSDATLSVTDDQGRYAECPDHAAQADYQIVVLCAGYGLVDSPKMRATAGHSGSISAAAPAPSAAAAAHYYPAIYWYSLLTIPDKKSFGGENGIPANVTQQDWLTIIKNRPASAATSSARNRRARSPPPSRMRRPAPKPGCGASSRASRRPSW